MPRQGYEFGVPEEGFYEEILNTDSEMFGGIEHRQRRAGLVAPDPAAQPRAQHRGHAAAAGGGGVSQTLTGE